MAIKQRMFVGSCKWMTICLFCSVSGCWQEIRYEHEPPNRTSQAVDSHATGTVEPPSLPASGTVMESNAGTEDQLAAAVPPTLGTESVEVLAEQVDAGPKDLAASDPTAADSDAEDGSLVLPPTADGPESAPSVDDLPLQPEARTSISPKIAQSAWQISSDWSMAAALQAKGRGVEDYGERLAKARDEALWLGFQLPPLPKHEDGENHLQKNLAFLLDEGGPKLAHQLQEQFGTEAAALAELATKSNVLLLSYSPTWTRLDSVVAAITQAAQDSGLPEMVWRDLVDLLAERAKFGQVKSAVFHLHAQAASHLAEATQ
ncbi:MAG: hypothetical protein AAGD11_14740 [Planctomycetota bacterium]